MRERENLQKVLLALQTHDVALPESGEYYDRLHAKIMANLPSAEDAAAMKPWYVKPGELLRAHFRSWWSSGWSPK